MDVNRSKFPIATVNLPYRRSVNVSEGVEKVRGRHSSLSLSLSLLFGLDFASYSSAFYRSDDLIV